MPKPEQATGALDSLLDHSAAVGQSPAARPAPVSARPAPVSAQPAPVIVSHNVKDSDVAVKLGSLGPEEVDVKRKYKTYRVTPTNEAAKLAMQERTVERCVDESDAKRAYFEAFGVGHEPSRFAVKVTLVK